MPLWAWIIIGVLIIDALIVVMGTLHHRRNWNGTERSTR
jgi:hypothetical protein